MVKFPEDLNSLSNELCHWDNYLQKCSEFTALMEFYPETSFPLF